MEFYATRKQLAKQLLRGALLLVASVLCIVFVGHPIAVVVGVIGLLFFVPLTVLHGARFARVGTAPPDLVFDEAGIHDNVRGWDVPWAAVRAVSRIEVARVHMLGVHVDSPAPYRRPTTTLLGRLLRRVTSANPRLGYPEITLPFADVEPGLDAALADLQSRGYIIQ